ncbi:hypothetical protein [Bacillus ndiopicus]|uniref:hypothetical protein n=1 Tax=Bacillus ndiopicus TaxID=1347368 RepID=UPI0005A6AA6A|nr:hypothetical protein [Bacillus ndiopicus]
MKKIRIAFIVLFILAGCSNKEDTNQQTSNDNESKLNVLIQQNEELKKQLEERPNLPSTQLKETLNLSIRIIQAMNNLDFNYLETVIDSNVAIDHEKKAFIFENGYEQNFLNVDYSILEYRFHHLENNVITVGFGQHNIAIYFEFSQKDGQYLLNSLITN